MSLFRSERMGYYNLVMPREAAWDVLNELGEKSIVEFIDQNPNEPIFGRPFSNLIKRCEDIEIKIKIIEDHLKKFEYENKICDDVEEYLKNLNKYLMTRGKAENTYLDEVESEIDDRTKAIVEQATSFEALTKKFELLVEYKQVLWIVHEQLTKSEAFKGRNVVENPSIDLDKKENTLFDDKIDYAKEDSSSRGTKLNYLAGTIELSDEMRFKRMIFRITKGNSWTFFGDYKNKDDPQSSQEDEYLSKLSKRKVFIIVYQGGELEILKTKLNKLCESFGAAKFVVPEDKTAFINKIREIEIAENETSNLLSLTRKNIVDMLLPYSEIGFQKMGNCSYLEQLKLFVLKEKGIYSHMNLLSLKNSSYTGYCWIPLDNEELVVRSLEELKRRKPNIIGAQIKEQKRPKHLEPPTYFRTNDFTAPFQEIVNTYGTPRYREVNPGLFAIVMFPFLFGVMFGDLGHGGALLIIGIWLVYNNQSLRDAKAGLNDLLDIRFLLLAMGFFGCYAGLIYNDFLSMPWNLFGSCFEKVEGTHNTEAIEGCVYPIGFDPLWFVASNELNFFNSLKMKMAVIIGVAQMIFGLILKGMNTFHFSEPIDFIFEVIPQIAFMICTFGYMNAMIVIKWISPWKEVGFYKAPSIINTMINIPLKLGSTEGMPLYEAESQENIQFYFLVISLISVPIMLFVKPLLLLIKNSGKVQHHPHPQELKKPLLEENKELIEESKTQELTHQNSSPQPQVPQGGHGHDVFEFSEIFVHQVIETIEFVLGSISNTASYLRLWALSLAHSQLSKVFFEKTIGGGIESGSFLQVFIGYFIFINITIGVLMCMDMMECFLHALRLQWVEFQGKFYKADGRKFFAFSFIEMINAGKSK